MAITQTRQIQLGETAPDFVAETTEGRLSFHEWIGDAWCIFFSHPKDFTPVCTTELGAVAKIKKEFDNRYTKIIALSVSCLEDHHGWVRDINDTQNTRINYPLIADENHEISELYGMIHPKANDTFTVRAVFIIDPQKKIRLTMTYPAVTGRNFEEILRVLDALQRTDTYSVATPANWREGGDCVILPSLTDPAVLKEKFPKGWKELRPYLRMTPDPR
jgi:alkyl hydroperoxide reductase subunit AhpC